MATITSNPSSSQSPNLFGNLFGGISNAAGQVLNVTGNLADQVLDATGGAVKNTGRFVQNVGDILTGPNAQANSDESTRLKVQSADNAGRMTKTQKQQQQQQRAKLAKPVLNPETQSANSTGGISKKAIRKQQRRATPEPEPVLKLEPQSQVQSQTKIVSSVPNQRIKPRVNTVQSINASMLQGPLGSSKSQLDSQQLARYPNVTSSSSSSSHDAYDSRGGTYHNQPQQYVSSSMRSKYRKRARSDIDQHPLIDNQRQSVDNPDTLRESATLSSEGTTSSHRVDPRSFAPRLGNGYIGAYRSSPQGVQNFDMAQQSNADFLRYAQLQRRAQLGADAEQDGLLDDFDPDAIDLNADTAGDRAIAEADAAAGIDPNASLLAGLRTIQKKLGSLRWNLQEDLFAWTRCGGDCFFDEKSSTCIVPIAIAVMLGGYGFGLSLFIIHLQTMNFCDSDMTTLDKIAKNNEQKLISCKDWASECQIYGTSINFKQYLQYRTAAYILLLIPFLYIPFMITVFINHSVSDIVKMLVNTLDPDPQDSETTILREKLKAKKSLYDAKENHQLRFGDLKNMTVDILKRMDRDGHSSVLLLLFFLFHGVMGGVSLYFDGSVFVTVSDGKNDNMGKCERYQRQLYDMQHMSGNITLNIRFLSMYQLIAGIGLACITLLYMLVQCRDILLHRNQNMLAIAEDQMENKNQMFIRNMSRNKFIKDKFSQVQKKLSKLKKEKLQAIAAAAVQNQGIRNQQIDDEDRYR